MYVLLFFRKMLQSPLKYINFNASYEIVPPLNDVAFIDGG